MDQRRIATLPMGPRGPYRIEQGVGAVFVVDRCGHQEGAHYDTAEMAQAVADALNADEGHVGVSP